MGYGLPPPTIGPHSLNVELVQLDTVIYPRIRARIQAVPSPQVQRQYEMQVEARMNLLDAIVPLLIENMGGHNDPRVTIGLIHRALMQIQWLREFDAYLTRTG